VYSIIECIMNDYRCKSELNFLLVRIYLKDVTNCRSYLWTQLHFSKLYFAMISANQRSLFQGVRHNYTCMCYVAPVSPVLRIVEIWPSALALTERICRKSRCEVIISVKMISFFAFKLIVAET